jgi:hypothetical protein
MQSCRDAVSVVGFECHSGRVVCVAKPWQILSVQAATIKTLLQDCLCWIVAEVLLRPAAFVLSCVLHP